MASQQLAVFEAIREDETMAHVAALYRYPVKGFTPERVDALTVQPDGRIAGDRVLAFRFARAAMPDMRDGIEHWPKSKGLALQDFPSLAALQLSFDERAQRVRIAHAGAVLVEAGLEEEGREALVTAVTDYVLSTPEGARLRGPGRLPLVLVGDGVTSRFQDRARGYVSVHSSESVADLEASMGVPVDDRRFRSNIVIEGVNAWDELAWQGTVRIGAANFQTEGPIVRCLATHANPDTGERDAPVLTALTNEIGQQQPTLGRLLLPATVVAETSGRVDGGLVSEGCSSEDRAGIEIRVGDEVTAESVIPSPSPNSDG